MNSCSEYSTSSSSFVSSDWAVAKLDPSGIVSSIHEAIILKRNGVTLDETSAAIRRFSDRLHRRVRQGIKGLTVSGRPEPRVDWKLQLLRPLIVNFAIEESFGVCEGDAEYILLLAATLLIAFELLVLADGAEVGATQMFVALVLDEYLVEPEVCVAVDNMLEAESVRLEEGCADAVTLRTIEAVRQLLPDHESCVAAWRVADAKGMSDAAANSSRTPSLPWTPTGTSPPTDVFVQVYLKPGNSWPFPFVTHVDLTDGHAVLNSSTGLTMRLEADSSFFLDISCCEKMYVKAPRTSTDGFVGAVVIPPNHVYPITKVRDVSEKAQAQGGMRIDTEDAVLEVGGDDYVIKRKDFGSRAVIENADAGVDSLPRCASPESYL